MYMSCVRCLRHCLSYIHSDLTVFCNSSRNNSNNQWVTTHLPAATNHSSVTYVINKHTHVFRSYGDVTPTRRRGRLHCMLFVGVRGKRARALQCAHIPHAYSPVGCVCDEEVMHRWVMRRERGGGKECDVVDQSLVGSSDSPEQCLIVADTLVRLPLKTFICIIKI